MYRSPLMSNCPAQALEGSFTIPGERESASLMSSFPAQDIEEEEREREREERERRRGERERAGVQLPCTSS